MIEKLIALGQSLESCSRDDFPHAAFQALTHFDAAISLQDFENETAQWLLSQDRLPAQLNLYNVFGEPPLTLFNNGRFAVDVYFWRKNDTLIHSHAFRGAFKVLYGLSLHEEFQVRTIEEIEKDLLRTELTSTKIEILKKDETRLILPGDEFTHRVVHLDNPTVSLCVRTVNDTELRQWHHLETGLSYQKRNLDEITIKRILYFQFLYDSSPAQGEKYLRQIIEPMDISARLNLYESVSFEEFGLDPSLSSFVLDFLRSHFEKAPWFKPYETHYKRLQENLFEHRASKASLKLLAHAINCAYPVEVTGKLLQSISDADLKTLGRQLLAEDWVFSEEHLELQIEKVKAFIDSVKVSS